MSGDIDWSEWRGGRDYVGKNNSRYSKNQYRFTDASCTVVEMQLSKGKSTRFEAVDLPLVTPYTWYTQAGNRTTMYAICNITDAVGTRRHLWMHRVLEGLTDDDEDKIVDHIDGDGLNNTKVNRRIGLKHGPINNNNVRMRKDNQSGYNGVWDYAEKQQIVVKYRVNGKEHGYSFSYGKKRTREQAMKLAIEARAAADARTGCENGRRPKFEEQTQTTKEESAPVVTKRKLTEEDGEDDLQCPDDETDPLGWLAFMKRTWKRQREARKEEKQRQRQQTSNE